MKLFSALRLSLVCRELFEEIPRCKSITLHDDSPDMSVLLIALIYDRNMEVLTANNVEMALELCKK